MSTHEAIFCNYQYDPLDRLVGTTLLKQDVLQRFYCKSRLTTEVQGLVSHSIFQQDDQILAQQANQAGTVLLLTNRNRSVLHTVNARQQWPIAYSPYGYYPKESGLLSLIGFNGEQPDPFTRYYLLGVGYRAFNPVLMHFNSPDSLSPFGKGGFNSYTYCLGDPVNRIDPTGHAGVWGMLKWIGKKIRLRKPSNVAMAGQRRSSMDESDDWSTRAPLSDSDMNLALGRLTKLHDYPPANPNNFLLQHLSQKKLTPSDHALLITNHSHAPVTTRVKESSMINFHNQYLTSRNREVFAKMANQNLLPGVFMQDLPVDIQDLIRNF